MRMPIPCSLSVLFLVHKYDLFLFLSSVRNMQLGVIWLNGLH